MDTVTEKSELQALADRFKVKETSEAAPLGQLAEDYLECLNDLDAMKAIEKRLNAQKTALADRIMHGMRSAGLKSLKIEGITLTPGVQDTVIFDDDVDWGGVIDGFRQLGYAKAVQRRISTKPIIELIAAGTRLPDGVHIDEYRKLNHRRN